MEKIDIAVIGAGVIGLSVGAELSVDDKDVFVFERYKSFGQETSSRNSEVIHSGIYYPHNTLKTKTCIEGNALLYNICEKNNVPFKKTGKLIVAVEKDEIDALEKLFSLGKEKGLSGIKMMSASEIKKTEPEIKAIQGIFLPTTGIIDTHSLMEYFFHVIRSNNADIVYDSEVTNIDFNGDCYIVTTKTGGGEYSFQSNVVINCAGLESDRISRMVGINDYVLHYCKGDYFRLGNGKNKLVKKLVYPVVKEDDVSLGVHITPDLAGGVRLGPDAAYTGTRDKEYAVDEHKKIDFFNDVKRYAPFIEENDLSVDTSGIRPKLQAEGEGFRDFVITHEKEKGFPGFINLVGIESPGLTAAPSIARMVKDMVREIVL